MNCALHPLQGIGTIAKHINRTTYKNKHRFSRHLISGHRQSVGKIPNELSAWHSDKNGQRPIT